MNGKVQIETISSQVLKGNPLGDPHRREIPVYIPEGYGSSKSRRLGLIVYLPGFTGAGRSVINYNPWKENLFERFDRLIAEGKAKPAVMVVADCFTAYGGSQYVNSAATGRYQDHVLDELVPFFEDKLGAGGRPEARAIMGKSSGGFGALWLAMAKPGYFGHVACHSGDTAFEATYGGDVLKFAAEVDRKYGGDVGRFRKEFLASKAKDKYDHGAVMILAMSACYSNDAAPCDPKTARPRPDVWKKWLAFDPVELAPKKAAALKALQTLFIDCGRKDEFFLQFGARRLVAALEAAKVPHVYEEHDGGHFDMNDRYDRSLPLLSKRLA